MAKVDREPCPWRIVDDAGGAFVFGLAGGTIWHLVGGVRNAPKGQRISQAISRAKARVPVLGGSFAVWGTLFSCGDCTFTYLRKKEDPWNAIMSGAATGGILAARAGMKAAGKSALVGGIILAAIEGLNILLMRVIMPQFEKQAEDPAMVDKLLPPPDPLVPRAPKRSKPSWESTPTPTPLFSSDAMSPTNDISSSSAGLPSTWATSGFETESVPSASSNSSSDNPKPTSSGWGLW